MQDDYASDEYDSSDDQGSDVTSIMTSDDEASDEEEDDTDNEAEAEKISKIRNESLVSLSSEGRRHLDT